MRTTSPVDRESTNPPASKRNTNDTLGSSGGGSDPPRADDGLACRFAKFTHTAVINKNEMQHESRSMNGTKLIVASTALRPPFPDGDTAAPPMAMLLSARQILRRALASHRLQPPFQHVRGSLDFRR